MSLRQERFILLWISKLEQKMLFSLSQLELYKCYILVDNEDRMMINIYLKMWKCRYVIWNTFDIEIYSLEHSGFAVILTQKELFFNLIILTLKIPNNWKILQESTQLVHNNTMLWNWIMVVVCSTSSMHTMYLGWGVVPVFLKK